MMFQFDLTASRFVNAASRDELPTDGELFVVTVALLLIREAAPGDLLDREVCIECEVVPALIECLEYRLIPFLREFKDAECLRRRLEDFVGLRIAATEDTKRRPPRPRG